MPYTTFKLAHDISPTSRTPPSPKMRPRIIIHGGAGTSRRRTSGRPLRGVLPRVANNCTCHISTQLEEPIANADRVTSSKLTHTCSALLLCEAPVRSRNRNLRRPSPRRLSPFNSAHGAAHPGTVSTSSKLASWCVAWVQEARRRRDGTAAREEPHIAGQGGTGAGGEGPRS